MLEGDENFAQMQISENRFDSDTNAQSLLYRHTGLTLPINALKYWLLGTPSPTDSAIELNEQGLLSKLQQNDWEVTFKRYTTQNNINLPNKIFLTKNGIKVRLIIQTWQIYS